MCIKSGVCCSPLCPKYWRLPWLPITCWLLFFDRGDVRYYQHELVLILPIHRTTEYSGCSKDDRELYSTGVVIKVHVLIGYYSCCTAMYYMVSSEVCALKRDIPT